MTQYSFYNSSRFMRFIGTIYRDGLQVILAVVDAKFKATMRSGRRSIGAKCL